MKKSLHKIFKMLMVCFAVGVGSANAQDIHFSQMEYSPLNLNPAMVGLDNPITAIVNFRTQWKAVATPYTTIGASFDARLNEQKRKKKGIFAIGVNFSNDMAGDAKITTTAAQVDFGYHLILNPNMTIGGAIYGGFGNRNIDLSAGRWGNQFDGMYYNSNLPTGETFSRDRFSYLDVGAGLVYRYTSHESYISKNDSKQITVGFAAFHLNRPDYSFINTNDDHLYMRFSAFVNGIIGFDNSPFSLMPGIYFQHQGPSNEILAGTYGRYRFQQLSSITGFNKGTYLSLGLFYRGGDAFIVKTMLEYSDFILGISYDTNVSTLNVASQGRGAFEVFLKYGLTKGYAGRAAKVGRRSKI